MFRRPRFRGLPQQQVPYESEASSRGRCAVDAAGGRSLGRILPNIQRRVCRVSLVQHSVSVALIAPVLMAVVLFYWLAFCLTITAWLKTIVHLLGGHFIRSALWLNVGVWMLLWWYDKPRDLDSFMPFACFFIGLGALAAFVRWRKKQQAMQVIPTTMPTCTPPKAPANDNLITLFVKDKS